MVRSADRFMILDIDQDADTALWHFRGTNALLNIPDSTSFTTTKRATLICLRGQALGFAAVRRIRRSGSFDQQVKLERFIEIPGPPVQLDSITDNLRSTEQRSIALALSPGHPVPPRTAENFLFKLERARPGSAAAHKFVLDGLSSRNIDSRSIAQGNAIEQRDALALGLEIAGIDSSTVLTTELNSIPEVPFLVGLTESSTSEASIIRSDYQKFDDWVRVETRVHDVARFRNPSNKLGFTTVIYADRTPLEEITGTDLIYFREETDAFILVQYKRMRREGKQERPTYRPDKQLHEEIKRMKEIGIKPANPHSFADFRLSEDPFFVKLVDEHLTIREPNHLSAGMYLPLAYFEMLITDSATEGKLGGTALSWDNVDRHITNTLFIELVKGSWIGTHSSASEHLSNLIQVSLSGNRGVVLVID